MGAQRVGKKPNPSRRRAQRASPDAYELSIDAQVEKFVDTKQKLTYFLITASVGVVAFSINLALTDQIRTFALSALGSVLLLLSASAGLFTTGCSLLNLHLEHRSFRFHLDSRYKRLSWDDLDEATKEAWTQVNSRANRLLRGAFAGLFIEVGLVLGFFVAFTL